MGDESQREMKSRRAVPPELPTLQALTDIRGRVPDRTNETGGRFSPDTAPSPARCLSCEA